MLAAVSSILGRASLQINQHVKLEQQQSDLVRIASPATATMSLDEKNGLRFDDTEAQKLGLGPNRAADDDEVVLSHVEESGLKRGLHQRHISMMALAGAYQ